MIRLHQAFCDYCSTIEQESELSRNKHRTTYTNNTSYLYLHRASDRDKWTTGNSWSTFVSRYLLIPVVNLKVAKRHMFVMDWYEISLVLNCSKKKKCLERVGQYWKRKVVQYEDRSNEAPGTDSQDSLDHGVCPTNPNVLTYKKQKHYYGGLFYNSYTLGFSAASMASKGWWQGCLLARMVIVVLKFILTQASWLQNVLQSIPNWCQMGKMWIRICIFWHQNFMGVVSRLPVATPRT